MRVNVKNFVQIQTRVELGEVLPEAMVVRNMPI